MPPFDEILVEAQERWHAMPADVRKSMMAAQRRSWVVGEMMIDHPKMSRAEAEELYDKVVLGIGL